MSKNPTTSSFFPDNKGFPLFFLPRPSSLYFCPPTFSWVEMKDLFFFFSGQNIFCWKRIVACSRFKVNMRIMSSNSFGKPKKIVSLSDGVFSVFSVMSATLTSRATTTTEGEKTPTSLLFPHKSYKENGENSRNFSLFSLPPFRLLCLSFLCIRRSTTRAGNETVSSRKKAKRDETRPSRSRLVS